MGNEACERFSFYGMQGILVIYLYYSAAEGGLGIDETTATGIVGAYGGLVYLSAILGAWVADRLFGAERTLTAAAVLIMCGHICLAVVPGLTGVGVGLICIALGSDGLRGELTLIRAARALAAHDGAPCVTRAQLRLLAPAAMRHRLRRDPLDEAGSTSRVMRVVDETLP